ncbi:MAG: hypothetical protein ABRQ25_06355 [Clostridiaceae bacterium]
MNRDCGLIESKIWLIGDSEPDNFSEELENPFDLKHPTVHNIVTPIIEQIQDDLLSIMYRLDWNKLYIRNAVKTRSVWKDEVGLSAEILKFRQLINKYHPIIIIPFGERAFEFVRRALNEKSEGFEWGIDELGKEFIERCQKFNVHDTNIIPLLHAVICRGNFLIAHKMFCTAINNANGMTYENYFLAAAKTISPILINNKSSFNCWKMPS